MQVEGGVADMGTGAGLGCGKLTVDSTDDEEGGMEDCGALIRSCDRSVVTEMGGVVLAAGNIAGFD